LLNSSRGHADFEANERVSVCYAPFDVDVLNPIRAENIVLTKFISNRRAGHPLFECLPEPISYGVFTALRFNPSAFVLLFDWRVASMTFAKAMPRTSHATTLIASPISTVLRCSPCRSTCLPIDEYQRLVIDH
jgi:hypothetical protein